MIVELSMGRTTVKPVEYDHLFLGRCYRSKHLLCVVHQHLLVIGAVHDEKRAGDAISEILDAEISHSIDRRLYCAGACDEHQLERWCAGGALAL